jgi:hypothetical protein
MKTLFKATLSCTCLMGLMVLAGCPAGAGEGATVEAGPMLCQLASPNGAGSDLADVTCDVEIGNAQASNEGIDTSVTNIMKVNILRGLCPAFRSDEVFADSSQFDNELRAQLSENYERSGIGWTVLSVKCKFDSLL